MLQCLSRQTFTNPLRLAELVDAGRRNLTVDNAYSVADMRSAAYSMSGLRSKDIGFITAPSPASARAPRVLRSISWTTPGWPSCRPP
jgi:hypothetical protein